jgi:hypothetical protein
MPLPRTWSVGSNKPVIKLIGTTTRRSDLGGVLLYNANGPQECIMADVAG